MNKFALCKEAVSPRAELNSAKSQGKKGSTAWRNTSTPLSCTVVISPCRVSLSCFSVCFTLFFPVFYYLYWKVTKSAGPDLIFNLGEMLSAQNIFLMEWLCKTFA